ncbi:hypothetical protein MEY_02972 [Candida albicans 19F]|nr:hypothetical protein MEY_02972 [Candida albicans 19F]
MSLRIILKREFSQCIRVLGSGSKSPTIANRFQAQYGNKNNNMKRNTANNGTGNGNRFHNKYNNESRRPYPKTKYQQQQQQQQQQRKPQQHQQYIIDPRKIKFDNGTESARNAIEEIINRVYQLQRNYQIQLITDSGLKKCHLSEILQKLDLSINGLQLIDKSTTTTATTTTTTTNTSDEDLPLIKIITVRDMINQYSTYLNNLKQLELIKLGSSKTLKTLDIKLKLEQKKSTTKEILMKWSINNNDFKLQKTNEIKKLINNNGGNGKSFLINMVYNKRNTNKPIDTIFKRRSNTEEDEQELIEIELQRRQLLIENLQSLLTELNCKWTIEGDINTKMTFNVTPKGQPTTIEPSTTTNIVDEEVEDYNNNNNDDDGDCDEKKMNRTERKKRKSEQQKQKQKQKQQSKTNTNSNTAKEEDLDALYSFKIED